MYVYVSKVHETDGRARQRIGILQGMAMMNTYIIVFIFWHKNGMRASER